MRGPKMTRATGMTLIELLIVIALVGIVLSLLTAFFRAQVQVTQQVQARNEVETKLRGAAEVMMQDLQLAGSRAVYDGTTVAYLDPIQTAEPDDPDQFDAWKATQCSSTHRDGCVVIGHADADVRIYYATSLDRGGADACRRIDYLLDDAGMLFRRDTSCSDATTTFDGYEFVSGIGGMDVSFICHDPEVRVSDPAECYAGGTYPREATVALSGWSEATRDRLETDIALATSLPNLRPPVDYLGARGDGT